MTSPIKEAPSPPSSTGDSNKCKECLYWKQRTEPEMIFWGKCLNITACSAMKILPKSSNSHYEVSESGEVYTSAHYSCKLWRSKQ